jgi:hypothetical protein
VLASGLAQRRIAQGFGFHKLVASAAFGQIASRAVELPTPPSSRRHHSGGARQVRLPRGHAPSAARSRVRRGSDQGAKGAGRRERAAPPAATDINAEQVVHVGVTRGPSEKWTAQQLRNVTSFGRGPQFVIRDRDDKYGADFDRVAKGVGTKVVRTAGKAAHMNSTCERFLGSVRREALAHVVILSGRHMKSVLDQYSFRYFNTARPHQGLGQRISVSTPRQTCSDASKVVAIPVLGGLHHDHRAAVVRERTPLVAGTGGRRRDPPRRTPRRSTET